MLDLLPGLVASYQYSVALVNVLISLLAFPLANLLWPRFLAQASQEGVDAMLQTTARVLAPLVLVLMACCSFTERFAVEIVEVLFARGSFDAVSVEQTSQALRATVFAAIPISLFTIFSRILFSQGRGHAIAFGGMSIALSGSGVVLLAGTLGSVALVQWHWVIGNTVGLLAIVYVLLRRTSHPARYVRPVIGWCARVSRSFWH
jgi:peptidoglycan biosynthesis protein MviN/MurJ (putative lipid II flippase)